MVLSYRLFCLWQKAIYPCIDRVKKKLGISDEVKTLEKRYTELFRGAKNRVDNSDTVKYNGDETQYAYNPDSKKRAGWGNGSGYLIRHFSGKINFDYAEMYISDEELAVITSSVKTGVGEY